MRGGASAGSGPATGELPVVVVVLVPGRAGLILRVGLGNLRSRRRPLVGAAPERLGLFLRVGLGDLGVVDGPAEGFLLLVLFLELVLGAVGVGDLGLGHRRPLYRKRKPERRGSALLG